MSLDLPQISKVSDDQFHGAMVSGLGRAEGSVGKKALAFLMDVTTKQLGNIFAGSAPHPKRLWDARQANPTVLDDIAKLYGVKIVDKDAVCNGDDLKVLVAQVNLKLQEYTHPDSPAGPDIAHTEFLDGEMMMRRLHTLTGNWIERCNDIRKPRVAA